MEALNSYEAHEKSSLALSRICLRKKDSEQCDHATRAIWIPLQAVAVG